MPRGALFSSGGTPIHLDNELLLRSVSFLNVNVTSLPDGEGNATH